MQLRPLRLALIILILAAASAASSPVTAQSSSPNRIELDATQAPTGIFHSHMTFPATARTLTLAYPKWIPGEHAPTGPLSQMVKLVFTAAGKPLSWRRDDLDMYLFHVDVPPGANQVVADMDFACIVNGDGFRSDICTSQDQLVINWWQMVLYPPALPNDRDPFTPTIRLPAGWHYSSALPVDQKENADNVIAFKTVSLKTLVDSPVIAGEHHRQIPLGGQHPAQLDITTETAESLNIPSEQAANFTHLVAEAEALFDGSRYEHYNLLLSLGDSIDHYTLEHLQSSENRLPDHGLSDKRILFTTASMIPHEYIHAWNGKYRTPSGLDIKTYQDPMKAALIWVYEGLTDYYGNILAARSGFWNEDQLGQALAVDVAQMTYHTGRLWRPLQDTTVGVQMIYESPNAWSSARRNSDFYPESGLFWLEADTIIRQQTKGQRSLDDFCKLFYGPQNGPQGKPYTFDDVVAGMNHIAPYDWKTFFHTRLDAKNPEPPLGGVENSGWKFTYTDQKSELVEDMEQIHKIDLLWPQWEKFAFSDQRYSIGLLIQDDGTVLDSAPGMAAYSAGIMPGMQLLKINGKSFALPTLEQEIRQTKTGGSLEFDVAVGNFNSPHRLDYHDGLKYPHLERDASKPDLLKDIAAPKAAQQNH